MILCSYDLAKVAFKTNNTKPEFFAL